jgi:hypothetical protein
MFMSIFTQYKFFWAMKNVNKQKYHPSISAILLISSWSPDNISSCNCSAQQKVLPQASKRHILITNFQASISQSKPHQQGSQTRCAGKLPPYGAAVRDAGPPYIHERVILHQLVVGSCGFMRPRVRHRRREMKLTLVLEKGGAVPVSGYSLLIVGEYSIRWKWSLSSNGLRLIVKYADAKFEVLGAPFSLLSVSLSASQNLFTRRGTLVALSGKAENVCPCFSIVT